MFSWAHTHTHFPQILYFTDIQDWRVLVSQVQLSASWCLFLILSFLVHIFFLSHFAVLTFNSWANLAVSLCLSQFRTSLLFCCFIFLFHFREHLHLIFFFLHFCCDFSCTHPCFICCLSGFSCYFFFLQVFQSQRVSFGLLSHSKWKYLLYPIFVIGVHASARERRDDDHII